MDEQVNGNRPGISVGTLKFGDIVVTQVSGEVDMSTVGVIEAEVAARLADLPAAFVLDLSGVDFFASVGIALLGEIRQRAEHDDIDFALVARQRHVLRALEVTGMDTVLPPFDALTRALATISLRRSIPAPAPGGEPVAQ